MESYVSTNHEQLSLSPQVSKERKAKGQRAFNSIAWNPSLMSTGLSAITHLGNTGMDARYPDCYLQSTVHVIWKQRSPCQVSSMLGIGLLLILHPPDCAWFFKDGTSWSHLFTFEPFLFFLSPQLSSLCSPLLDSKGSLI